MNRLLVGSVIVFLALVGVSHAQVLDKTQAYAELLREANDRIVVMAVEMQKMRVELDTLKAKVPEKVPNDKPR